MSRAGKCHCGQVQWTVELPDESVSMMLCHCGACKAMSSSGYSQNQMVPKSAFRYTKGEELISSYTYTSDNGGLPVHCYFCSICSCHPYHQLEVLGPDTIVVKTVHVDGGLAFVPAVEIFGVCRQPWQKEIGLTFDNMPPA
ncbi:hypothetical protein EJ06DRAFT_470566 [Trichodelitschia bisporula]|uniref:CENP-V/GFA domain-containing protein n=1 Tax=Trichodelitschia bisporula TaxID=703511 RepID=A0A6G1I7A6_9PEZI|nr:hypothetical protein EJ06DRAFT_470566 [Trichodelitschia bisporula]